MASSFFFVVKQIRALKGSKFQVFVEEFLFVWDAPIPNVC